MRDHRVISALALIAGLVGCQPGNEFKPPPPADVTVARPERRDVTDYLEYTGTAEGVLSVELRARVRGFLEELRFRPGDDVEEGDLLFVIEKEPFEARVASAKADLASKQALVTGSESDYKRNRQLFERSAYSEGDLIKSRATLDAARAAVDAARAALVDAELNLGYTEVRAPISGRITRNLVDVGNLVGDMGATTLATIVKYDPIYAYITISEADLLRYRATGRAGGRPDYRTAEVPLELGLPNEEGYPHKGRVDYSEPRVDPASGTVLVRGLFPNPDGAIVPGLFVRVRTPIAERPGALLVPERALGRDQQGSFLLVVEAPGGDLPEGKPAKVAQRPVKVGTKQEGEMRLVESGLGPDEWIVVDGVQKARPGAEIQPKRADAAAAPAGGTPVARAAGESTL